MIGGVKTPEEDKMTVSTLVYIKDMLEKEVDTRERAYKKLRDLVIEKEEESGVQWNTPDNKVNGNVQALRSMRQTQMEALNKAKGVLEDFMAQDWK